MARLSESRHKPVFAASILNTQRGTREKIANPVQTMSRRAFRIVCVSGFFDPLHVGHIEYLENARLLGDKLIVILNDDCQRSTRPLMSISHRIQILKAIRFVDHVVVAIDKDAHVSETLHEICPAVFAKGLHASEKEALTCEENHIELVENVGQNLHFHDLIASFR